MQQSPESRVANNPGGYFSSIVEQNDAFAILKGCTNQDIYKYVHLSDEELTAIIKLRLFVRATGNSNRHNRSQSSLQPSARCSNVSSLSTSSCGSASLNSVGRSSVTSTESIPLNRHIGGEKTLRRPPGQQAALLELAPDEDCIHPNSKSQGNYWCTVCEPARHFRTSGGWIKHEKERHEETAFVCMPEGPTLDTAHGLICVLCGAENPDAKHLQQHNIEPCLNRAVTARTYTRFYQLQKHLETHNVSKGSFSASRWRRGCNKQAWACGLCVAYFANAKERFNHIATKHYERGEDISRWDPSKVILGLLQQPRVYDAWTKHLKLEFPSGEKDLRWDRTPSRSLITMLGLGVRGTEDGADLARAAFTQSDYYQSRFDSQYSTITPIEGTERGVERSRRGVQDSHRFELGSHNSEQNPKKSTIRRREVLAELASLDPSQTIHSSWSPKSDKPDPSSYEIQPPTEQSTWPDPVLFGADYPSHCEPKNSSSSLSYVVTPLFGECEVGQPTHAPIGDSEAGRKPHQENLRIKSKGSISPLSQNKPPVSKFSTHRSVSPMDVDDLEPFGGILGNEDTIFEPYINLWG
ncbi:hypothetical protein MMC29_006704 [Sticta canariensis]|nr:hypothetical protein [Sticta canariensis]